MAFGDFIKKRNRQHVVTKDEWESRVKYADFNEFEQSIICHGGCGVLAFGLKLLPDFIFKPHCCRHDFNSVRGGDARVRKLADKAFVDAIWADAKKSGSFKHKFWAKMYGWFVLALHRFFFSYGKMKTEEEMHEWIKSEADRLGIVYLDVSTFSKPEIVGGYKHDDFNKMS